MPSAKIRYQKREWQVPSGTTVRVAIESLGLDPQAVLALRNKKVIQDNTLIEPGDEIKLVNMISGG